MAQSQFEKFVKNNILANTYFAIMVNPNFASYGVEGIFRNGRNWNVSNISVNASGSGLGDTATIEFDIKGGFFAGATNNYSGVATHKQKNVVRYDVSGRYKCKVKIVKGGVAGAKKKIEVISSKISGFNKSAANVLKQQYHSDPLKSEAVVMCDNLNEIIDGKINILGTYSPF